MISESEKINGLTISNRPSFWEQDTFLSPCDYLIIGSGIVGLSAAIQLKTTKPSARVTVIERGVLPSGASTKNAGFACFGSVSELQDDLETQTEDEVFSLVEMRWKGLQRLRKRTGDAQISYKEYGAYEVFKTKEEFEICADKIADFNKLLKKITRRENTYAIADPQLGKFGFKGIQHLIVNHCEGQIHTGKMMAALLSIAKEKNIQILNGIGVQNFEDQGSRVLVELQNGWQIATGQLLIATNGFTEKLIPEIDLNPARNQVLITKPIPGLPFKGCFHFDKGYVYFRNIGDRVLLGGGRNIAPSEETTAEFGLSEKIQSYLLNLLQTNFLPHTDFEVDHWWSGIMGVGNQKRPIVKRISDNVVISVRLGGMGVAIGTLVGERGADLLLH